jgi:hypothetical protein
VTLPSVRLSPHQFVVVREKKRMSKMLEISAEFIIFFERTLVYVYAHVLIVTPNSVHWVYSLYNMNMYPILI